MKLNPAIHIDLLTKTAEELGFTVRIVSGIGTGRTIMISDGKKMYLANNAKCGFYPEITSWQHVLMKDKMLSQTLLKEAGYKTIPSLEVRDVNQKARTVLTKVAESHLEFPIVFKPNTGMRGKGIHLIDTDRTLKRVVKTALKQSQPFLLQEFLQHPEYRILIVGGEAVAMYYKEYPHLIGTGNKTVAELLRRAPKRSYHEEFLNQELKKRELKMSSILPAGAVLPYGIAKLRTPKEYVTGNELPEGIRTWAQTLAEKLSCPLLGVDVLIPNKDFDDASSYTVVELNANPAFHFFQTEFGDDAFITSVWKKILTSYFSKRQN